MKKYYYDFGYFFSNKDSGSLRVTTTEPLDTDDTDGCVEYALEHNLIDKEYAGNIIYVEQMTKDDARDMGFDVDDETPSEKTPSEEPEFKFNIYMTCPKCGSKEWLRPSSDSLGFKCANCGKVCYVDDMVTTINNNKES